MSSSWYVFIDKHILSIFRTYKYLYLCYGGSIAHIKKRVQIDNLPYMYVRFQVMHNYLHEDIKGRKTQDAF